MEWRGYYVRIFWLWTVLAHLCGYAQIQGRAHALAGVDAAGNSETVEAALHIMSDIAPVIFVGTVTDIHRTESLGMGAGAVEIRFAVEQAIRGCSGSTYILREWGGLWTANDSRYRVGQRLLLLLHAPGATGLSSPVGGMDGAIPVRASGSGLHPGDASAAAAEQVADLRWIAAKLKRTVVYRTPNVPSQARALAHFSASPAETAPASVDASSTPAQEATVTSVVSMIRSWQGGDNATR